MYDGKVLLDDKTICQYHISDGASIFNSPGLNVGGGEINKGKIKDALREIFRNEGEKFDLVIDGLTALIQKGDIQALK